MLSFEKKTDMQRKNNIDARESFPGFSKCLAQSKKEGKGLLV